MRSKSILAATAVVALSAAALAPAAFANCTDEVQAAFEKQRMQPAYRVTTHQPSPRGEVEMNTDFQRPDRMYNKVVVPGEPGALETIAVGRWAWASHGMGFQELQPQFAQAITADVANALGTPVAASEPFTCLGKVERDGKALVAYRTVPTASPDKPEGPDNPPLARTVLIDPDLGLPVASTIAEAKEGSAALVTVAYSYPKDLVIEAPLDAVPAQRPR